MRVTTGPFGEDPTTLTEQLLRIEAGAVLNLERTADDRIEIRVS